MNENQQRMASAARSGLSAIVYVTDPARWPAFAAFAEQIVPGESFTEAGRLCMRDDGKLLDQLARALEEQ